MVCSARWRTRESNVTDCPGKVPAVPGVSPARSGRSSPRKAGRAEGRSRGSPRSSARAHSQARRHGALAFLGSVAGCFDNALAESVFLTLECGLFDQQPGGRFKNRQAKLAVFDYLRPSTTRAVGTPHRPDQPRSVRERYEESPAARACPQKPGVRESKSTPGWASTTRSSLNRLWKIWTGFASWAS